MAKIFQDGDPVTKEWLNKVSQTVTDGLGDKATPGAIRVHIGAEASGAAGAVQGNLNSHVGDTSIHTPVTNIVLQSEKGAANGVAPLGGDARVPAIYLPSGGGYTAVYETRSILVDHGLEHLEGQLFLVTNDLDSNFNGDYTAIVDSPLGIGGYYFNSGSVSPHTHPADQVNVESLGVTVEDDSIDLHALVAAKADSTALTTHTDDATIHFADAPDNATAYNRKGKAWIEAATGSGTGDLKSDFSVKMVGVPEVGQDISTKKFTEDNFTGRFQGYATPVFPATVGEMEAFTGDLNTHIGNGEHRFLADSAVQNFPAVLAGNYCTIENHYRSLGRYFQIIRATQAVASYWYRSTDNSGASWSDWVRSSEATGHQYDNTASGLTANRTQSAIDEIVGITDGLTTTTDGLTSTTDALTARAEISSGTSLPGNTTGYKEGDVFIVTAT